MNIFFGKISQNIDKKQIEEGYYHADRYSGWFGELQERDYVYLIGGGRIQFWQVDKWNETNDRLSFKILNKDLGIGVNDFIALKMFRLTKPLIVLTSRSARNRAFFKLETLEDYLLNELSNTDFYKDKELYRKIIYTDKKNIKNDSSDIQLYSENDKLSLFDSSFYDPEVYKLFRDNIKMQGGGFTRKDSTLEKIQKGIDKGNISFYPKDISLRSFYDAFFCDYIEKEIEDQDKEEEIHEDQNLFLSEMTSLLKQKKNLILQGAPGTGKTYRTAEIAVALCKNGQDIPEKRNDLMTAYNALLYEDRIMFTTFHQSLDYEEFIEGIKPDSSEGSVTYSVKPGIFKLICDKAKAPIIVNNKLSFNSNPTIWKVSLKGTYENEVRSDCLENNRIRIGWDQYGENIEEDQSYPDGGKIVLDAFINKMRNGDIVMSCYSQNVVDAIGVVTGEYEWVDQLKDYKRCRKVKWLIKNVKEDIYALNNNTIMTLSTVYKLNNFSLEKVMSILEKYKVTNKESITKNTNPYVLIIDEINRGNISKIFGELITLLEADKRIGEVNQIKVRLPYSPKEEFGVPSNLYIIGTMNTADRSLGYIDYAVRRRFAFKQIQSDRTVIESYNLDSQTKEKALNLFDDILLNIEQYIEHDLVADDLMLGHSYFLAKNLQDLRFRLEYEIIPLIREYEKDGILKIDKVSLNQLCEKWVESI